MPYICASKDDSNTKESMTFLHKGAKVSSSPCVDFTDCAADTFSYKGKKVLSSPEVFTRIFMCAGPI